MDNSGGFIKKYSLFILATILFALSVAFTLYSVFTYRINSSNDYTIIGNIYIGDNSQTELSNAIAFGVNEWESNAVYTLTYQNQNYSNIISWFDFNLNVTLDQMTLGSRNDASFGITQNSKDAMLSELSERFPEEVMDAFDYEDFFSDVIEDLKQMYYIKNYQLVDYLNLEVKTTALETIVIENIDPTDVTSIMAQITSITISETSRFSLLDELSSTSLSNEQLSIIASGIEKVILNTYFTGITKSQYTVTPSWATETANVRILRVNQLDFQFFNDLPLEYLISIEEVSASSISFTLSGYPNAEDISVTKSEETVLPFETILIEDDLLTDTTVGVTVEETVDSWIYTIVDQVGSDGYIKIYTRSITDALGETRSQFLMNEYLSPTSEIIRQNIVLKGD